MADRDMGGRTPETSTNNGQDGETPGGYDEGGQSSEGDIRDAIDQARENHARETGDTSVMRDHMSNDVFADPNGGIFERLSAVLGDNRTHAEIADDMFGNSPDSWSQYVDRVGLYDTFDVFDFAGKTGYVEPEYGVKDFFTGILESAIAAATLGFVETEFTGVDLGIFGPNQTRDKGASINVSQGLANVLGGPIGGLGYMGVNAALRDPANPSRTQIDDMVYGAADTAISDEKSKETAGGKNRSAEQSILDSIYDNFGGSTLPQREKYDNHTSERGGVRDSASSRRESQTGASAKSAQPETPAAESPETPTAETPSALAPLLLSAMPEFRLLDPAFGTNLIAALQRQIQEASNGNAA